jgi:hypothetical protein
MKKIKLLTAILAITLIVTSSYRSETAYRPTAQYCFEFTGYDMMEPVDWTMITVPEPTCNYTSGSLCYIKADKDFYGNHPTAESLVDLSNSSSNFTQPYMGTYGKVRLRP